MKCCSNEKLTELQNANCVMLAHAYVPWQVYSRAYSPREALTKGTIFPDLWGVYRIPK